MEHVDKLKLSISALLALLTALWGWFGWLVVAWVICMALDYLTGTAAAMKAGEWSSARAREGLWHKLGSVVAVLISGILDLVFGTILRHVVPADVLPFHYTVLLCPLVIFWYIITEAGSIIENAGKLDAPIPGWLRKAIAALKKTTDAVGEKAAKPPDGEK